MDSTTNSIAALSTTGISPEEQEAPVFLKVMWGAMFAVLSYIMLTIAEIDGIKLVSNLGADRPKTCLDMMQMTWVDTS